MLIWAALGSNSKRVGRKPEKSYSERSAVWTKRSAASSVSKRGNGLRIFAYLPLILVDLLLVLVADADRSDEAPAAYHPDREHDEDVAPGAVPAHRIEQRFRVRRVAVGLDERCTAQGLLDLRR